MSEIEVPDLLTPGEVAALFRVDRRTVMRWANQGKLKTMRTLGGHRRFFVDDVRAVIATHSKPE